MALLADADHYVEDGTSIGGDHGSGGDHGDHEASGDTVPTSGGWRSSKKGQEGEKRRRFALATLATPRAMR
jgi:hypothetical protein